MGTLRAIKAIIISGVFAAGCSIGGVSGIHDWLTYKAPTPARCGAADLTNADYVALDGCEALLFGSCIARRG